MLTIWPSSICCLMFLINMRRLLDVNMFSISEIYFCKALSFLTLRWYAFLETILTLSLLIRNLVSLSMKSMRWSPIPLPKGNHPYREACFSVGETSIAYIGWEPLLWVAERDKSGCLCTWMLMSLHDSIRTEYSGLLEQVISSFRSMSNIIFSPWFIHSHICLHRSWLNNSRRQVSIFLDR